MAERFPGPVHTTKSNRPVSAAFRIWAVFAAVYIGTYYFLYFFFFLSYDFVSLFASFHYFWLPRKLIWVSCIVQVYQRCLRPSYIHCPAQMWLLPLQALLCSTLKANRLERFLSTARAWIRRDPQCSSPCMWDSYAEFEFYTVFPSIVQNIKIACITWTRL